MKRLLLVFTVLTSALIGAILGVIITLRFVPAGAPYASIDARQQAVLANYHRDSTGRTPVPAGLDFEKAAMIVTPAVVHIRTILGPGNFSRSPFDGENPHAQSSGSGVIISDDGYIVTNFHVIEDANSIEVTMNNNQRFYAQLVGTDAATDLALLKIKASHLPFVKYGNSDDVRIGEWVLAIGNPFNLNSTVTAGIISARARNINILFAKNNLQIESFLQTDAAVNPGNSGGALVNLDGELVGINSAIATSTGSYSGYSFAIPTSLVKKIMDDLLEFGQAQRGLLGVEIQNVTPEIAEDENLDVIQGVFIAAVHKGSAALESGIEAGDVITAIDGHPVGSISEMQEWVARNRPGQKIWVTYHRHGAEKKVNLRLKSYEGSETTTKKEVLSELKGVGFKDLKYTELTALSIDGGVQVTHVPEGKWKTAGVKEGFIITYVDKVTVDNLAALNRVMELKRGGVLIEGIYPDGKKAVYGVSW